MGRFIAFSVGLAIALSPPSLVLAQKKKDGIAGGFPPDQATLQKIHARSNELARALADLRRLGVKDPILADVEVYHRAAQVMVRNNDFNYVASADWRWRCSISAWPGPNKRRPARCPGTDPACMRSGPTVRASMAPCNPMP